MSRAILAGAVLLLVGSSALAADARSEECERALLALAASIREAEAPRQDPPEPDPLPASGAAVRPRTILLAAATGAIERGSTDRFVAVPEVDARVRRAGDLRRRDEAARRRDASEGRFLVLRSPPVL